MASSEDADRLATLEAAAALGALTEYEAGAAALLSFAPAPAPEAVAVATLPPDVRDWKGPPPRPSNSEPYRQPWAPEEDTILRHSVSIHGARQWTLAAAMLPGRSAKQCRERWVGALDPSIRQTPFTEEEDELVVSAYRILGSRWAEMAKMLTGRTDNAVKNRANSGLRALLSPAHAQVRARRHPLRPPPARAVAPASPHPCIAPRAHSPLRPRRPLLPPLEKPLEVLHP